MGSHTASSLTTIDIKKAAKENTALRAAALHGDQLHVSVMHVDAGESVAEYVADTDQVYLVIKGEGSIRIGEDTVEIEEHDAIVIPRGVAHVTFAEDDEDLKIMVVSLSAHDYLPLPTHDA
jgi:mannose-6-phosphate isomerase-like protein (cupin superfamily)